MKRAMAQMETEDLAFDVARVSLPDLAQDLQEILTQKLVAYIIGISDGRDIGRYARQARKPHAGTDIKLRELYNLISIMRKKEDSETIQIWFQGRNPELGDISPARLLHDDFANYSRVKRAIEKFLSSGE